MLSERFSLYTLGSAHKTCLFFSMKHMHSSGVDHWRTKAGDVGAKGEGRGLPPQPTKGLASVVRSPAESGPQTILLHYWP